MRAECELLDASVQHEAHWIFSVSDTECVGAERSSTVQDVQIMDKPREISGREFMALQTTLRTTALSALAAGALLASTTVASAAELRLSHQWSTSDVRHKVAQIVADSVAAADVDLEIKIFPSK